MPISFTEYFRKRSNRVLDTILDEMAVKNLHFGSTGNQKGAGIAEIRKTPIFLDWDDIQFLNNFPPRLWSKALSYRYSDLLFAAEKAKAKGEDFPDVRDITFASGRGKILFKNVDTKINSLHDKLTRDTNDRMLRKLQRGEEGRKQYTSAGHGDYGFVVRDPKESLSDSRIKAGEGFMGVTGDLAAKKLQYLRSAFRNGWIGFDDQHIGWKKNRPEGSRTLRMALGGGAKSKRKPVVVYGAEKLHSVFPDKHITPNGKAIYKYYRLDNKGNVADKVVEKSYVPILVPSKQWDNASHSKFHSIMARRNLINRNIRTPEQSDSFVQSILDRDLPSKIKQAQDALDQYKILPFKKQDKKQLREMTANLLQLKRMYSIKKMLARKLRDEGKTDLLRSGNHAQLGAELKEIMSNLDEKGATIQQNADRLDLHSHNVQFWNNEVDENGARKYKVPYGHYKGPTIHVNRKQPGAYHGGRSGLWEAKNLDKYLFQAGEVDVPKNFRGHIDLTRIPYTLRRNFLPNDANREEIEAKIEALNKELISGQTVKGKGKNKKVQQLTEKDKKIIRQKMFKLQHDMQGEKMLFGPIGEQLNDWLDSKRPTSPADPAIEYYALTRNWGQLLVNAYNRIRSNINLPAFDAFFEAEESGHATPEELDKLWNNVIKTVKRLTYNYVSSVWQLDLGNNTRRLRGRGGANVSTDAEVDVSGDDGSEKGSRGESLSNAENRLKDHMQRIVANKKFSRPRLGLYDDDQFQMGVTGSSLSVVRTLMDKEAQEEASNTIEKEAEALKGKRKEKTDLSGNLIDTALAYHGYRTFYIQEVERRKAEKKAAGKPLGPEDEWNPAAADAWADEKTKEYMSGKGVKLSANLGTDIKKDLDDEEIGSLERNRGIGMSKQGASSALDAVIKNIEDADPSQREKLLGQLRNYVAGLPADDPDMLRTRELANRIFVQFGKEAPFPQQLATAAKNLSPDAVKPAVKMDAESSQDVLQKVYQTLSNDANLGLLNPQSPTFNKEWANLINRWADDPSVPDAIKALAIRQLEKVGVRAPKPHVSTPTTPTLAKPTMQRTLGGPGPLASKLRKS